VRLIGVDQAGGAAPELELQQGGARDQGKHQRLPVAERAVEAVAQPAPQFEIDEGGEGPHLLLVGSGAAQQTAGGTRQHDHGQRQPLVGHQHGGQGDRRAPHDAHAVAAGEAEQ